MKKIILSILCMILCFPIFTKEIEAKNNEVNILVQIENAADMYLLNIKENSMKVKIISNKIYLPISCLNKELSTIKSIDFTASYNCLLTSLNTSLHTDIQYYAYVKMEEILKRMNISKNAYDYQTLASLCDVGNRIKEKINFSLLLEYKKYIDTNIDIKAIYTFYHFFKKEKITIDYYTLSYFVIEQKYIPMSTVFHLKKKT